MNYNDIYTHPNKNAEIYREMRPEERPKIANIHLQFIAVHNDETAILGASNMTDRYWSGSVWMFNDCTNFDRTSASISTKTESGVIDGGYLESDKFLIVEDSGLLQILMATKPVENHKQELVYYNHACQHDDSISSVSIFDNKTHFVTSGADCCLKVWQVSELLAEHSYSYAHSEIITCVDTKPKSQSEFVSTSLDCQAIIWDVRSPKPASCVYEKPGCGLTAVAWDPSSEHFLAVGGDDGGIVMIDARQPNSVLTKAIVFPRPVHKLKFHPQRSNLLAGCCNGVVVKIVDPLEKLSAVYEDTRHKDIVRGLAWCKDDLLTCSWDDTVLRHDLSSTSQ